MKLCFSSLTVITMSIFVAVVTLNLNLLIVTDGGMPWDNPDSLMV